MITGWLMGLTMQIADFETSTVDLVQQQQQLTNLTSLLHQTDNSIDPTVQADIWTTGQTRHSLLIPDQSVQSNVVMIFLLAISIVIYFSVRRSSLS